MNRGLPALFKQYVNVSGKVVRQLVGSSALWLLTVFLTTTSLACTKDRHCGTFVCVCCVCRTPNQRWTPGKRAEKRVEGGKPSR